VQDDVGLLNKSLEMCKEFLVLKQGLEAREVKKGLNDIQLMYLTLGVIK